MPMVNIEHRVLIIPSSSETIKTVGALGERLFDENAAMTATATKWP